jgi:arylsulfatase
LHPEHFVGRSPDRSRAGGEGAIHCGIDDVLAARIGVRVSALLCAPVPVESLGCRCYQGEKSGMTGNDGRDRTNAKTSTVNRRNVLIAGTTIAAASAVGSAAPNRTAQAQPPPAAPAGRKPNILMITGDDVGWYNPSTRHRGVMGYRAPNIARIGDEGAVFTDWYGEQSGSAGNAAFFKGQSPIRTGLDIGLRVVDPSVVELLKPFGYATGQFGKNHPGYEDERLPTNHGFEETVGDDVCAAALDFIDRQHRANRPWLCSFNATRMHVDTQLQAEAQGKTGRSLYPDALVEHDGHVGQLLDKLDDLGVADSTIVVYTTDDEAEEMSRPDGGNTPFAGEKATNWQGGYRVPMVIRWPGVIRPGTIYKRDVGLRSNCQL